MVRTLESLRQIRTALAISFTYHPPKPRITDSIVLDIQKFNLLFPSSPVAFRDGCRGYTERLHQHQHS